MQTHTHTYVYRLFAPVVLLQLSGVWLVRVSAGGRTVLPWTAVVILRLSSLTIVSWKILSFAVSQSAVAVVLDLSSWSMLMTKTVWGTWETSLEFAANFRVPVMWSLSLSLSHWALYSISNSNTFMCFLNAALVKSRVMLVDMIMRLNQSPSCTLRQQRLRASFEMPGLMPSLWQIS